MTVKENDIEQVTSYLFIYLSYSEINYRTK